MEHNYYQECLTSQNYFVVYITSLPGPTTLTEVTLSLSSEYCLGAFQIPLTEVCCKFVPFHTA